jgi:carboxyl-terminal processing protease
VIPDITLPSTNEFLPIGEGDLVRPMQWDQIASSSFDGSPLDPKVVTPLKQSSLQRQSTLEEFAYLRKNVDRFKVRYEQKLISVNLSERQKQKEDDDAFRKEMKAEREQIAKSDFAFKPFYLGPPPAPRLKAPKKDGDGTDDDDSEEENDTYVKADVHLRETLRVISDAIALGQNRDSKTTFTRAPLTASTRGG